MYVGFLGPPNSGKTTVAAALFAELKKESLPVEFIVEGARMFIANKKYLSKKNFVALNDDDQAEIALRQMNDEVVMSDSLGKMDILVTDGCGLNSLLYMTLPYREKFINNFRPNLDFYRNEDVLLYQCSALPYVQPYDPNRIHSSTQISELNSDMVPLLIALMNRKILLELPKQLNGSVRMRVDTIMEDIYERLTARN